MARGKGKTTSTLALVGWALLMLLLGLGAGLLLGQQGCGKREAPAKREAPKRDKEYDSFDQFVHEDRGLAAMVVGIVFIVFLTPVLITGLLIWYKLRKNRMLNETMVHLAEKGVAPSPDMLLALQSGRTSAAVGAVSARATVAEQVKTLRSQAAWSDLRKGVMLAAVGLALTAWSILDDQTANSVGLVLLFLGIGYAILWYFEDRQLAVPASALHPPATPPPPPAGGA